jgi:hypothetical protein
MLWALTAFSASFSASPAIFFALAAIAGLLALGIRAAVAARRHGAPAATGARAIALCSRARRSVFLRLRDPDAAGRPRPRAPSTGPAAA